MSTEQVMAPEPDFMARTREALDSPQPGDRFHEMYSWWTLVVAAGPWGVTVLQASGPFNLVPGQVRNDESPDRRRQRRERGEPYQEWLPVAPWQERAELRHFDSLAAFQKHMGGELLADRGLDITEWPQRRAAAG